METTKTVSIPVETVGHAYLEILRVRGKYFFGNSGGEFGPIIDASVLTALDLYREEF